MNQEAAFQPEAHADQLGTARAPLDWRRAHEELSALARNRARLDYEEGIALLSKWLRVILSISVGSGPALKTQIVRALALGRASGPH